jgi:hypothetical protein
MPLVLLLRLTDTGRVVAHARVSRVPKTEVEDAAVVESGTASVSLPETQMPRSSFFVA